MISLSDYEDILKKIHIVNNKFSKDSSDILPLTMIDLFMAEPIRVWGYRQAWAKNKIYIMEFISPPEEKFVHDNEVRTLSSIKRWHEDISLGIPDNHQTIELLLQDKRVIYLTFHENTILIGTEVISDSEVPIHQTRTIWKKGDFPSFSHKRWNSYRRNWNGDYKNPKILSAKSRARLFNGEYIWLSKDNITPSDIINNN